MKATTFFRKNEKPAERGGEAVVQSGKLYIVTDSGIIAKPRMAIRQAEAKRDPAFEEILQGIANHVDTLLPSFYVNDDEYVLYAKTGIISQYPLHLREIQQVFWNLRNGIQAMHDHGIAHLDIKTDNIVLCDNGVPALIDFGCSGFISDKTVGDTTLMYAPPEYFMDQTRYHRAAHDVWSFAMSILELAVPESFSEFKANIPNSLLSQAMHFESKYSEQQLKTTLAPMLNELREKNATLANLIEPLLCFDPQQREENFKKLPPVPTRKIATVLPMPENNEASMRAFIKSTNQRIQHIKQLQKSYTKDDPCYQRLEYQITVCRNQREQVYVGLGKVKSELLPPTDGIENWNPNVETQELDSLIKRFDRAKKDDKNRIAFKIIRAADTWLYEHPRSKNHKVVQKLLSGFIRFVKQYNTPLKYESFRDVIQSARA